MRNDRVILAVLVSCGLALYTALAFAFFSSEGESRQFYMFLLGVPIAAVLMIFPRAALIVTALAAFSFRWLYDSLHVLPREGTWLVDILIVTVVARAFVLMPTRKERLYSIIKYVFILIAFALISSIINRTGQVTMIAGLRIGFRYVMLFVAATQMDVSARWLRNYMVFLLCIGALQLPVVLAQFSTIGWTDPDRMSGTFGWGGSPSLGLFLMIVDAYLLCKMFEQGRFRISYATYIAVVSTMAIFSEIKIYFLFLPVLLFFIIRTEVLRRPAVATLMVLTGVAIIIGANIFIIKESAWVSGNNPLTFVTKLRENFDNEVKKGEEYGYNERGFEYVSAIRLAAESPRTILLGNGPGSLTDSYMSENHSPKLAYYAQWHLTSIAAMSIVWLLMEYGYLGVAMILFLFFWIYRRGRFLRHSPDQETRVLGRTLECLALLYGVWQFYQAAWQLDAMSFSFWPLAGLLVGLSYREEARQKLASLNAIKASAAQSDSSIVPLPARA